MFADILRFISSKQEKECYMKTTVLPRGTELPFCQHFKRRTTQQTLSAINLTSELKITKLSFSSQVIKQFKLLKVPFKPLRCCLRSDRLVPECHVWKFYNDLFLNFRVIWSVNQIVLFNGFLSDFVEITSCAYTKTIILSISVRNIYLAASRLAIYISRYSPWFQRIIVNYKRQSIKIIMSINEFIKLHKVYSLRGIHVLT